MHPPKPHCFGNREPTGVCYMRGQCAHFVEWPSRQGKTKDACTPNGGPFVNFVPLDRAALPTPSPKARWYFYEARRLQQQEMFG